MAEILTLYNNPTGTGRTLTWEQGESGSHTYDLIIIDQTGQPVDLTGCSVALYFKPSSGTVQIGATVSSSGDSASLTVPGEATQSPGTYQAWVAVVRPSPQQNIIINNLAVIIRANVVDASAPEAEPYFGELTQMIADGQQAINDLEALIPVSVANGGTGANNAVAARTNLGAASVNHTHSLPSSNITGILPVSKGGTGSSTASGARNALGAMAADATIPISQGGTGGKTAQAAMTNIQNDSSVGWHAIPLESGVTPGDYGTRPIPSYRRIGNEIIIEGGVACTLPSSGTVTIGYLPEGYRPLANVYTLQACSNTRVARVYINTSGMMGIEWVVNLYDGTRYSGEIHWVQIDMRFFVDGGDNNTISNEPTSEEASVSAA